MSTVWKLRILNTKYKDVEVSFSTRQLLGRNENTADLVIDDPLISEEHVNIIPSDDGITLEPLVETLAIRVNGQVYDDGQAIPLMKPIHIGELVLMFAEMESEWPENIPNFERITPSASKQTPSSLTSNEHAVKQKKHPVLTTFAMLLLLFIPGIIYLQANSSSPDKDKQTFDLKETKALLNAQDYPHLTVDWNPSNRQLSLGGYVITNEDRNLLLKQAETLQTRFSSEIRTMDEIKAATVFILKNLDLEAKEIKYGDTPGSLIFVTDESELRSWSRAENILQRDIPGLKHWQLEVLEEQPALEQLKALLEKSSFKDKVTLEDKGDRIELIGNLSGPETREFKTLKQAFTKSFGANPYLVLVAPEIAKEDTPNLNIAIRAVHIGEVPYLVLENGRKYFKGARLPNGTRISSIESDAVYLQADKDTFAVYFDTL